MKTMFKKIISLLVVISFLYSNAVWAEGAGAGGGGRSRVLCNTLSADGKRQLQLIQSVLSPPVVQALFGLHQHFDRLKIDLDARVNIAQLKKIHTDDPVLSPILDVLPEDLIIRKSETALYVYAQEQRVVLRLTKGGSPTDSILRQLIAESEKHSPVERMGEDRRVQFFLLEAADAPDTLNKEYWFKAVYEKAEEGVEHSCNKPLLVLLQTIFHDELEELAGQRNLIIKGAREGSIVIEATDTGAIYLFDGKDLRREDGGDDGTGSASAGVGAKGDQVQHLHLIARQIRERFMADADSQPGSDEGFYCYRTVEMITDAPPIFTGDGIRYEVRLGKGSLYFTVLETRGRDIVKRRLYFIPFEDGTIIVPPALDRNIRTLLKKDLILTQGKKHEEFEMADRDERLRILNESYKDLNPKDKLTFLRLFSRHGIRLIVEDEKITGWGIVGDGDYAAFGHIGGEILELVEEYKSLEGRYPLEDFTLSSLDAAILGFQLRRILRRKTKVEIDVNQLIDAMVNPGVEERDIVLRLVGDGDFSLEILEEAAEAVSEAGKGVTALDLERLHTKAALVAAGIIVREGLSAEVISRKIFTRYQYEAFKEGLIRNGYENQLDAIRNLILDVIKEMEISRRRIAGKEDLGFKLNNPYINGLLGRLADMAGMEIRDLFWMLYLPIVNTACSAKGFPRGLHPQSEFTSSMVETGVAEAQKGKKLGFMGSASTVSPVFHQKVIEFAKGIFISKLGNDDVAGRIYKVSDVCLDRLNGENDPLGVIEDMLANSPLGRIGCSDGTRRGTLASLVNFLEAENRILTQSQQVADPVDLAKESKKEEVIISLNAILEIEGYDHETRKLVARPKGLGIKKVLEALPQGHRVKIVDSQRAKTESMLEGHVPEGFDLAGFADGAVRECLSNIFGLSMTDGISLVADSWDNVLGKLDKPNKTVVLLEEQDKEHVSSNRGAFLYVLSPGELLINAIGVSVNMKFKDGGFTEDSKVILREYYLSLLPREERSVMTSGIQSYIDDFNLSQVFCRFPMPERITTLLNEIAPFRMLVDLSA